jgi:D-ribose pyranose/furanose isomerase RbsD
MEIEKSYVDEQALSAEIAKLKSLVPFCQYIYNALQKMGIPADLPAVQQFAARCRLDGQDQSILSDLRKLLLTLPKYRLSNNAAEAQKTAEIQVPDYLPLKKWIENNWPLGIPMAFDVRHLVLKDDKIEVLKLNEEIKKKHTQKFKVLDPSAVSDAYKKGKNIIIQHDEHHIKNAINTADEMLKDGQQVYDMFTQVGVEVSIAEIGDVLQGKLLQGRTKPSDYIQTLVLNKLVAKAGSPTLNGIAIKPEKVKDMIQVPDVSHIITRVNDLSPHWYTTADLKKFMPEYVQIKDGKLMYAEGFLDGLNEKHVHTTKSKRGLEIAAKLMEVSAQINDLVKLFGTNKIGQPYYPNSKFSVPGLKIVKRTLPEDQQYMSAGQKITEEFVGYRIDLDFIRHQEQIGGQ